MASRAAPDGLTARSAEALAGLDELVDDLIEGFDGSVQQVVRERLERLINLLDAMEDEGAPAFYAVGGVVLAAGAFVEKSSW